MDATVPTNQRRTKHDMESVHGEAVDVIKQHKLDDKKRQQ